MFVFFREVFSPPLPGLRPPWLPVGRGSGHANVTAVDSLSWVEGLCIESIRADLNRWLPLTFTGGPFPINLQGPPPLEEWLQPLPPAAATTTNTKQANPRIGPKSSSCITSWLRPKAKRHRLEKHPEPARLHIQELLSWLIPTLVFAASFGS